MLLDEIEDQQFHHSPKRRQKIKDYPAGFKNYHPPNHNQTLES